MKTITILFMLLPLFNYAQNNTESEFWFEELAGKRVFLNKTVTSFNFTVSKYQNGKVISKEEYVNFDKPEPSKITISSDENKANIQISSRYYKEDLFFEYKRIYKLNQDGYTPSYNFVGKGSCDAKYFIPEDSSHQSLLLKCLDDGKNGTEVYFVISQRHQL